MLDAPVYFPWSQSIAAGATFTPSEEWEYETPDRDCMLEVFERATATGLVSTVKSGGDTIKQEGPVQAGGTAGTTPSRLNTEPITGKARRSQKVRVFYRNPTGGAITVDGQAILIPGGGRNGGGGRRVVRRGRKRRK